MWTATCTTEVSWSWPPSSDCWRRVTAPTWTGRDVMHPDGIKKLEKIPKKCPKVCRVSKKCLSLHQFLMLRHREKIKSDFFHNLYIVFPLLFPHQEGFFVGMSGGLSLPNKTFCDFRHFLGKTFCDFRHFLGKTFCDFRQIVYFCSVKRKP